MNETLERLANLLSIYDRVHEELNNGKPWSEIDSGLADKGELWTYEQWRVYFQQSIINAARSVCRPIDKLLSGEYVAVPMDKLEIMLEAAAFGIANMPGKTTNDENTLCEFYAMIEAHKAEKSPPRE